MIAADKSDGLARAVRDSFAVAFCIARDLCFARSPFGGPKR